MGGDDACLGAAAQRAYIFFPFASQVNCESCVRAFRFQRRESRPGFVRKLFPE
jgi:hypothetical protein